MRSKRKTIIQLYHLTYENLELNFPEYNNVSVGKGCDFVEKQEKSKIGTHTFYKQQ